MSADQVRAFATGLPEVEEGPCYGTPGFRVRGKLFARLHQDGESIVVRADLDQRDMLVKAEPDTFFVTDHYRSHPWVLARLTAISRQQLAEVLLMAWRLRAPKRLIDARGEKAAR